MYSEIKDEVKTVEGVMNMSSQNVWYAYKWVGEGGLTVTDEVEAELINQMNLRGL